MIYNKRVQSALSAGFSIDEIKTEASREYTTAIGAGFSQAEARQYMLETYGLRANTSTQDLDDAQYLTSLMFMPLDTTGSKLDLSAEPAVTTQAPATPTKSVVELPPAKPKFGDTKLEGAKQEKVTNISQAMAAGWQSSIIGLALRGEAPQFALDADSSVAQKVASSLAMGVGDIPSLVLGGTVGAAAGAPGGPAGALLSSGAVAMGVTEYLRSALMQSYLDGSATTWGEFSSRIMNNFAAAGKGAVIGSIAAGAAPTVSPLASSLVSKVMPTASTGLAAATKTGLTMAGEVSALGVTMPMLEGHFPSVDDFMVAGVTLGGFKAANLYTKKFAESFIRDGITPKQANQLTLIDPEAKLKVAAVNQRIVNANKSVFAKTYTPLTDKDLRARGLDLPEVASKKFTEAELDTMAIEHPIDRKDYTHRWLTTSRRKAENEVAPNFGYYDLLPLMPEGTKPPDILTKRAAVGELWIPKFGAFINWVGNKDSVLVKVANKYAETDIGRFDLGLERDIYFPTTEGQSMVSRARALFNSPTKDFIDFMRNTVWEPDMIRDLSNGKLTGKAYSLPTTVPWVGIRKSANQETSYYMFEKYVIKRPDKPGTQPPSEYSKAQDNVHKLVSIADNQKRTWSQVMDNAWMHLVDVFEPLRAPAERGKITESYLDASMAHGSIGKSIFMFEWGMLDYATNKVVGDSLKDILSRVSLNGGDIVEFSEYMAARGFKESIELGRTSPLSSADISSILKGPRAEIYSPIADSINALNKQLLKYQLDAGLITKSKFDGLSKKYKESIPLEYLVEAFEPALKDEAIKTAERITAEVINKGEQAGITPTSKLFMDPVESQIRSIILTNRLVAQNEAKKAIATEFGVRLDTRGPGMKTLSFVEKGRTKTYAIPREIYDATRGLTSSEVSLHNAAFGALAKGTGVFRLSTTGHVTFAVKAATIDQFVAWIQTPKEIGFCPYIDMFRGLGEIITSKVKGKESAFTDWLKDGGANSSLWSITRDFTQEMIRETQVVPTNNAIKNPGKHWKDIAQLLSPLSLAKNTYKGMLGFTENLDAATRVGVYMKAIKAGYDPKEAAFISRRSTIDFNRAGATIKSVNSIIAFLNARVQGLSLAANAIASDPVTTISKLIQGIVVPSAMLALVSNDIMQSNTKPEDDLYELAEALRERPTWRRAAYWAVPVPALGVVLEIPKPHEYATALALPMESFVDWLYKQGTPEENTFLEQLSDNGFVSGMYDTMVPNVIPTPLVAPNEIFTNYSFFTGSNIVPARLENVVPALQYKPGTSTTARMISEAIFKIDPSISSNPRSRFFSPLGIDHLVRGWTGPVGQSLVKVLDAAIEATGAYDGPIKPATTMADMPFFSTFMTKYPSMSAHSIEKFNEEAKALSQRYNSIVMAAKTGDPAAIRIASGLLHNTAFANMQSMFLAMSNMSKAVQQIHIHNTDPESKRLQIENIYIQMARVARQGRLAIKQLSEEVNNAGE